MASTTVIVVVGCRACDAEAHVPMPDDFSWFVQAACVLFPTTPPLNHTCTAEHNYHRVFVKRIRKMGDTTRELIDEQPPKETHT